MRGFVIVLIAASAALAGCERPLTRSEIVSASNVEILRKDLAGGAASGDAPAEVVVADPTGFGTLKGRFKLVGTAPPRTPLKIDKEQDVCAPGGKTVLEESLVVSSNNEIRDVAVYLVMPTFPVGNEKWEHPDYAAQKDATVVFDQKQCIFLSHVFPMRATQKARLTNSDPVGHNTNINHERPFNSTIAAMSSTLWAPEVPSSQPISVTCSIHPWMSSYMMFSNTPLYDVSKADGTFEIKNVPAGVDLTFRAWQERAKLLPQVTVGGKQENWKKGFKVKLEPGQTLELDVEVAAEVFQKK